MTLALLLLLAAEPTGVITAHVFEVHNATGRVGCLLFVSEKGFPTKPAEAAQMKWCSIANKEAVCAFDPVPAGHYAVACIHDENGNAKFDFKGAAAELRLTMAY